MYYIYFLFSPKADKFYIGYSDDPERRLLEHNSSENNTFTKKFRPWTLVYYFPVSNIRSEAMKIEKFIKKQKSKRLIEKIITDKLNINNFQWVLKK